MIPGGAGLVFGPGLARALRRACVFSALVAGAFMLVVAAVLVVDYVRLSDSAQDESIELLSLRKELSDNPIDDALKSRIRELDLELRNQHFRAEARMRVGIYLLAGGAALCMALVQGAAWLGRQIRRVGSTDLPGWQARASKFARWAVAALAVVLVASAGLLAALSQGLGPWGRREWPDISGNWPRFRGPGGLGVFSGAGVPQTWDVQTGEGILWKRRVPLPGNGSPVIAGDRLFLAGADDYRREVYCFHAGSGELLWRSEVGPTPEGKPAVPDVMEDTGLAPSTPATDGKRVFAVFPTGEVAAFDLEGKRLWARNFGKPRPDEDDPDMKDLLILDNPYGHATSLLTHGDTLLVQLDQSRAKDGLSKLLALDAATGRTVWEKPRPVAASWATPIIAETPTGAQLITCANPWVIAYDPADGSEIWRADVLMGDVAPSPVASGNMVFVVNDRPQLSAIRTDGRGDVTETHVVWKAEDNLPDIVSPLTDGQRVYLLDSTGMLTCYDARTGEKLYEQDLGEYSHASPSLVGDTVYVITDKGVTIRFRAGPVYKELGRADLGERVRASPAFADGAMFIRGRRHLYCMYSEQE